MSSSSRNVASGIWLMLIVSGGAPGVWMRSGLGRTIATGAGLALLTLIIGMIMGPPAAKCLGQIAAAGARRYVP